VKTQVREERLRSALRQLSLVRGAILGAIERPTDANVDMAVERAHHLRIDLYGAQHAKR
jgi:hypothetical protein